MSRIAHHITNEPTTVSDCLRKHFRLSPEQIESLFHLGAIYSNKRRILEDCSLNKGTYLRIHLQPKRFPLVDKTDWKSTLVADTEEYVVVNKPAGIPVHASVDNHQDNALFQLRRVTGYSLLVTQRLDIPVGGLFVFAKTPEFQRRFNQWLVDRKVQKTYLALSKVAPPTGLHVHFMEPSERVPKKVEATEHPGWQRCELTVESVRTVPQGFESRIQLHTGRTHQIRSQMSALGSPLLGDRLYGSTEDYRAGFIALFSAELTLPSWPRACFKANPPWFQTG